MAGRLASQCFCDLPERKIRPIAEPKRRFDSSNIAAGRDGDDAVWASHLRCALGLSSDADQSRDGCVTSRSALVDSLMERVQSLRQRRSIAARQGHSGRSVAFFSCRGSPLRNSCSVMEARPSRAPVLLSSPGCSLPATLYWPGLTLLYLLMRPTSMSPSASVHRSPGARRPSPIEPERGYTDHPRSQQ